MFIDINLADEKVLYTRYLERIINLVANLSTSFNLHTCRRSPCGVNAISLIVICRGTRSFAIGEGLLC
jgi:hypothetical protein